MIVNRLRPKVSNMPGLKVYLTIPQPSRVGGRMSKSSYDFTLYGPDTQQLYTEAQKLERVVNRLPGLAEVTSDLQIKNPQVNIVLDRDRAAALNVNWNNVASVLYDAFGPQLASTIYSPTNQYQVLLEMLPQYQRYTDGLKMLYLKSDTGQLVPLNAVARLQERRRPAEHSALRPIAFGDAFLRAETGHLARPGDRRDHGIGQRQSAGHHHRRVSGHRQVFRDSMRNMGCCWSWPSRWCISCSACCTKATCIPITILSGLPSAGFGALAHADLIQGGPEHLLVCGNDHADRHREEERHHADRFRAGGRA
jgi:hydrophobic/amphiphilic exporter-1 (mainly G- bacteria), HAE1 family